MTKRRAMLLLLPLAVAACSSLTMRYPDDGAVIQVAATSPTIPVVVEGQPNLRALNRMSSGQNGATDVTAQMSRTSSTQFQGGVSVVPGRNKLIADATIDCWYCSGGMTSFPIERNICVYTGALSTSEKTAQSVAPGNLSWSLASRTTVAVAPDGGTPEVRWKFLRLGGFASSAGLIMSAANPCLCLRSDEPTQNSPIGLAICDGSDTLQQWQTLQAPNKPVNQLRVQNNGRGVSDACLTQNGAAGSALIQRSCNDTPEQLWTVRDNASGRIESNPW